MQWPCIKSVHQSKILCNFRLVYLCSLHQVQQFWVEYKESLAKDASYLVNFTWMVFKLDRVAPHLCFKHARPKMCHSPKVDDGVEIFFTIFLNNYFRTFFFKEL